MPAPVGAAAGGGGSILEFRGERHLRHRLVLATLAGRPVRITGIRAAAHGQDDVVGLTGVLFVFVLAC